MIEGGRLGELAPSAPNLSVWEEEKELGSITRLKKVENWKQNPSARDPLEPTPREQCWLSGASGRKPGAAATFIHPLLPGHT